MHGRLSIEASLQLSKTAVPSFIIMVQLNQEIDNILTNDSACIRKLGTVAYVQLSVDVNDSCETQTRYFLHTQIACTGNLTTEAYVQLSIEFFFMLQLNQKPDNIHTNDDICTRKLSTVTNVQLSADVNDPSGTGA